jgi:predicted phosphoadenosine phosphosulfate sulfurtransferase
MPLVSADVLTAARGRMAAIFDAFPRVVVSVSGGKDSTVLRELALEAAAGRRFELFFLDQEAEYRSTVDVIEQWMADPRTESRWFQVPLRMTNATSHRDIWLYAWGPGEQWLRPKHPAAIREIAEPYPKRFYDFFYWYEEQAQVPTAFVVGLRSRESLNRWRATNPAQLAKRGHFRNWSWTSVTKRPGVYRCYPIYDWSAGDVWKYIADRELPYNRHYDRMFAKYGNNVSRMRVSNLIHEHAFRCLVDLQEFEPDTYEKLLRRLGGVHAAALYANEKHVLAAHELPSAFSSWRSYRDYLIETTPGEHVARLSKRFTGQPTDESTCRQQAQQVLINDWENNAPVRPPRVDRLRRIWWDRL